MSENRQLPINFDTYFQLMKKLVLPVIFAVSMQPNFSLAQSGYKESTDQPFAVVELFTSEGCSSCPPADSALQKIDEKYKGKNVLVLGYHVDYWDKLGWKDAFSDSKFTARQQYYGRLFHLESIYTPQVVVNGKKEIIGSNYDEIDRLVETELNGKKVSTVKLEARQTGPQTITVTTSLTDFSPGLEDIWVLLVQKTATRKIKAGENRGATLHHINIVRDLVPVSSGTTETLFKLPKGLEPKNVFAAILVGDVKTGQITRTGWTDIN